MNPETVQYLAGEGDDISSLGRQVGNELLRERSQDLIQWGLQVRQHPEQALQGVQVHLARTFCQYELSTPRFLIIIDQACGPSLKEPITKH